MPNPTLPPEAGEVIDLPEDVIDAMVLAYHGGMIRRDDPENPRGYTTYFAPGEAMRAALLAALPHFQAMQTEAVLAEREKASAFLCAEAADYEAAGPFGMVVCAALTQASSDLQNEKHVAIRERKP